MKGSLYLYLHAYTYIKRFDKIFSGVFNSFTGRVGFTQFPNSTFS